MIEKPNSLDMMEKFNQALSDIEKLNTDLDTLKNKVNTKINIINVCNTYTSSFGINLNIGNQEYNSSRLIFNYEKDKCVGGEYNIYGQTLHAQFVRMPTNVFNLLTETGPIYKDNAIVEFYTDPENKDYLYSYSDILKHESDVSKNDVFKTFENDTFTMAVQVNVGNMVGGTFFNMIEICPYLPGSFNIEQIRLFTIDQYYTQDLTIPDLYINDPINDVGAMRIALDNKYQLYRIEFDIRVNYVQDGYPFGLRHLYFLNADMDTESDYVIAQIDKNDYLETIGENITIIRPTGNLETTLTAYGVECYLFYENNVLSVPVTNPISRNVQTFYAKIPLKEPLIGIEFKEITTR